MKSDSLSLLCLLLGLLSCYTYAHSVDGKDDADTICEYTPYRSLQKRAPGDDDGGQIGVTLPNVGLTLGNITTKLGNINLTIEDITIGNITVIVSVPLPGASPINAFSHSAAPTSIATSTNTATSTVSSPTTVSQTGGFIQRLKRQDDPGSTLTTVTPTPTLPDVPPLPTVTVGGGNISAGAGSVDTEIGNITIFVGNVNVSIGDVKVKNVSIGNIFVLVQIGQPDITGAIGNLSNTIGGVLE